MATLATLKLSAVKKSQAITPAVTRRNKLSRKIGEQMELAKAHAAGGTYVSRRFRTVRDEDGSRRTVEIPKMIRQWWWTAESGKLAMNIRYGASVLELAKGKATIELASFDDVIPTLQLVKQAVESGELDAQIDAASAKLRDGFGK